jgi:hypothetical protein
MASEIQRCVDTIGELLGLPVSLTDIDLASWHSPTRMPRRHIRVSHYRFKFEVRWKSYVRF